MPPKKTQEKPVDQETSGAAAEPTIVDQPAATPTEQPADQPAVDPAQPAQPVAGRAGFVEDDWVKAVVHDERVSKCRFRGMPEMSTSVNRLGLGTNDQHPVDLVLQNYVLDANQGDLVAAADQTVKIVLENLSVAQEKLSLRNIVGIGVEDWGPDIIDGKMTVRLAFGTEA